MANEAASADEGTMTVRRTVTVAAPVATVWRVVTEPEHLSRWLGATALDGRGPGAEGAEGTVAFSGDAPVPIRIEAVDPPRSITFRWRNEATRVPAELDVARSTVFTLTLEPVADGTRLTVVETGFEQTADPRGELDSHRRGWDVELDELVALVEAGVS